MSGGSGRSAENGLHALWREAAEKGITEGIDWPGIALHLFRDLDNALAEFVESDAVQYALTVAVAGQRTEAEVRLRDAAKVAGGRYVTSPGSDES